MDTCIWNHDYPLPSVEAYFGRQNVGMQSVCPIAEFYLHVARVCGSVIELYETAPYDGRDVTNARVCAMRSAHCRATTPRDEQVSLASRPQSL